MQRAGAVVVTAIMVAAAGALAEGDGMLKAGDEAPKFGLPVINKEVAGVKNLAIESLVGAQAGAGAKKALIVSFFANYCEPCKRELPFLQELYGKYKDQGLGIMVITIDKTPEDVSKASDLVKDKGVTYPVLTDRFNIVAKRYGVTRLPCLYVVGSDGKIAMANAGYTDEFSAQLLATIQTRLGVPLDPAAVSHPAPAPAPAAVSGPPLAADPPAPAPSAEPAKGKGKRKKDR